MIHSQDFFSSEDPLFSDFDIIDFLKNLELFLYNFPLGQHKGFVSPQATLVRPELISIGKGSVVEPGAYIMGPCHIGENTEIRHAAYLRGNVYVGNDCVVGHCSEVKNSVFLQGAKAGHFAYVGDSILGYHVNLGAGVKCANLKLKKEEVSVSIRGVTYKTGLRKLGAIIGDYSQIGCNAVTNPGCFIEKNVLIYPLMNVGGYISSGSKIKPKAHARVS